MLCSWQRRARAQNDFATSQSDAFAASGFRLALGKFGLTAESGPKLRIAPSSIRDLRSSTSSFRHCALHHRLTPLVEQLLHRFKRFAALRRGLSNRIDGAHKTLAFGLVQRLEQFEILKIKHVMDNDGIVQRLLGKVAKPVCRMLNDPFGPLLFTPIEDLLSKQQLFFFRNLSRIELVQRSAEFFNKL